MNQKIRRVIAAVMAITGLAVPLMNGAGVSAVANASTWTSRTSPEDNGWSAIAFGNDMFVAVADSGTNRVMTSTDGITWTARTAPVILMWSSVTFGNGIFVAVAIDGTGNGVMTTTTAPAQQVNNNSATTTTAPAPTTTVASAVKPTLQVGKLTARRPIALYTKLTLATSSRISITIAKSSRRYCRVSGAFVKGLAVGPCRLTVKVTPKKGIVRSRTVTLTVAK